MIPLLLLTPDGSVASANGDSRTKMAPNKYKIVPKRSSNVTTLKAFLSSSTSKYNLVNNAPAKRTVAIGMNGTAISKSWNVPGKKNIKPTTKDMKIKPSLIRTYASHQMSAPSLSVNLFSILRKYPLATCSESAITVRKTIATPIVASSQIDPALTRSSPVNANTGEVKQTETTIHNKVVKINFLPDIIKYQPSIGKNGSLYLNLMICKIFIIKMN